MNIKIMSYKTLIDAETFSPVVEAVVQLPVEPITDESLSRPTDEFHRMVGEALVDAFRKAIRTPTR